MTRMRFRGPRVIEGGRTGEATDARVAAVLDVLAGGRAPAVAERHGVDPALLHRWTQAFTEAGTAAVTNRPGPDLARQRDRFLSVFTHGLRSPLAVAQAWVGLLGDMSADAASREQALVRLQAALDLLDERTGEVELLTAAMLGRVEPDPHPITVGEVAASLTLPDDIGLRIVREGDPVDPATARALFEPFDSPEGGQSGITVGLYLARALTVVHGGTVGMEQDEHHGVLWVRVPDPPAADPHHQEETP